MAASGTGQRGAKRFPSRIAPVTAAESASVAVLAAGKPPSTCHTRISEFLEVSATPEHVAEHGDGDLRTDAREKSAEHRAREKIREKSQLEEAGQEQHRRGQRARAPPTSEM